LVGVLTEIWREMDADRDLFVLIEDTEQLFECSPSLKIRAALENIRNEYHFREGVIKLN
jgi:hypothetical protein